MIEPMTRSRTRPVAAVVLLALLPVAGCATVDDVVDDVTGQDQRVSPSPAPGVQPLSPPTALASSSSPSTDPDAPSGWGPTVGELSRATELVSAYDDAALAATVLMPGFWGYD